MTEPIHSRRQPDPPSAGLQRSLRRRLVGGSAWALGARIAYVVTTVGVGALVTRLLSPEHAGTYFVAISVATSLAIVAALGLRRVMVRFVASSMAAEDYGRARRAVVRIFLIGGTAAAVLGLLVGSEFGSLVLATVFKATDLTSVALLIGLLLTVRALGILRAEAFRGLQDFRLASVFDGADAQFLTAASLLGLVLVLPSVASLELVLGLTALAWLPGLVVGGLELRRRLRRLSGTGSVDSGEIVRSGWPLWVQDIGLLLLTHADLWIVAALLGARDAALYGAAFRFIAIISLPIMIVNAVVPPIIAELATQKRWSRLERVLRTAATLTVIPALVVTVGFVVGGSFILSVVFGPFYADAWPVLALMSIGQFVNVWVGSCGLALIMTGHERTMMVITLGSGIAMVLAAALVARPFGIVGVAVAAAAGFAMKHLIAWVVVRRRLGIWTHGSLSEARWLARELRHDFLQRTRS